MQSQEWTSLILSSRRGRLDIVKKLLDKGADMNKLTNVRDLDTIAIIMLGISMLYGVYMCTCAGLVRLAEVSKGGEEPPSLTAPPPPPPTLPHPSFASLA